MTALQVAGAYSTVANGGRLMEPKIIQAIVSPDGVDKWRNQPARVRTVMSPETCRRLNRMLQKVVTDGTGKMAQVRWDDKIKVAGKTGTAQKYVASLKRYSKDLSLVSFCGFLPADHPQYTILVILDEPEGKSWGGTDAAPVFRRIAENIYQPGTI